MVDLKNSSIIEYNYPPKNERLESDKLTHRPPCRKGKLIFHPRTHHFVSAPFAVGLRKQLKKLGEKFPMGILPAVSDMHMSQEIDISLA